MHVSQIEVTEVDFLTGIRNIHFKGTVSQIFFQVFIRING